MRIVVCLKEVLDPDAVDNYALAGRLQIADDGKSLVQGGIPRLINAYDEQALEAALRLRDAGAQCRITAVSIGFEVTGILRHASALGADEVVAIAADPATVDCAAMRAATSCTCCPARRSMSSSSSKPAPGSGSNWRQGCARAHPASSPA